MNSGALGQTLEALEKIEKLQSAPAVSGAPMEHQQGQSILEALKLARQAAEYEANASPSGKRRKNDKPWGEVPPDIEQLQKVLSGTDQLPLTATQLSAALAGLTQATKENTQATEKTDKAAKPDPLGLGAYSRSGPTPLGKPKGNALDKLSGLGLGDTEPEKGTSPFTPTARRGAGPLEQFLWKIAGGTDAHADRIKGMQQHTRGLIRMLTGGGGGGNAVATGAAGGAEGGEAAGVAGAAGGAAAGMEGVGAAAGAAALALAGPVGIVMAVGKATAVLGDMAKSLLTMPGSWDEAKSKVQGALESIPGQIGFAAKVGFALAAIPGQLERFGDDIVSSSEGMERFSAGVAMGFQQLEVQRRMLAVRMGMDTSNSFGALTNAAMQEHEESYKLHRMEQTFKNVAGTIVDTWLTGALAILESTPLWQAAEWIRDKLEGTPDGKAWPWAGEFVDLSKNELNYPLFRRPPINAKPMTDAERLRKSKRFGQ